MFEQPRKGLPKKCAESHLSSEVPVKSRSLSQLSRAEHRDRMLSMLFAIVSPWNYARFVNRLRYAFKFLFSPASKVRTLFYLIILWYSLSIKRSISRDETVDHVLRILGIFVLLVSLDFGLRTKDDVYSWSQKFTVHVRYLNIKYRDKNVSPTDFLHALRNTYIVKSYRLYLKRRGKRI